MLGNITLADFHINTQTKLVKLCHYDYLQLANRQAVTWMRNPGGAPERCPLNARESFRPATFASDIYCLVMALRHAYDKHAVAMSSVEAQLFQEEFLDKIALADPHERPSISGLLVMLEPFLRSIDLRERDRCAVESYIHTAQVYRLPDGGYTATNVRERLDAALNGEMKLTLTYDDTNAKPVELFRCFRCFLCFLC